MPLRITSESEHLLGRLGLGSEDDHFTPHQVATRGCHSVKSVFASNDGTFVLNTSGRLLACGSNEHNKLGMNNTVQGLRKSSKQVLLNIIHKQVPLY